MSVRYYKCYLNEKIDMLVYNKLNNMFEMCYCLVKGMNAKYVTEDSDICDIPSLMKKLLSVYRAFSPFI